RSIGRGERDFARLAGLGSEVSALATRERSSASVRGGPRSRNRRSARPGRRTGLPAVGFRSRPDRAPTARLALQAVRLRDRAGASGTEDLARRARAARGSREGRARAVGSATRAGSKDPGPAWARHPPPTDARGAVAGTARGE